MGEMGLGDAQADIAGAVQAAAVPEADVAILPQHLGPLGRLQGDAVGSRKAGGDETDIKRHSYGSPAKVIIPAVVLPSV